jgi:hypothetical protein
LIPILKQEKLLAVKCNVFKGEKLCYLFVGRAAYKGKDALNPEPWQLPSVFVMRFTTPPPLKRIHPFDTGAFDRGRMPDYLTTFDLDDFNVGSDQDQIGRMISLYFETPRRYVDRDANDQKKLKDEHLLTMSHAKVLAVAKLYKEGSTKNYDDRAAAIELQVEEDKRIEARLDAGLSVLASDSHVAIQWNQCGCNAHTQDVPLDAIRRPRTRRFGNWRPHCNAGPARKAGTRHLST